MKKILGLDLGSNSIGWAVINKNNDKLESIDSCGSRIIPMDAAILGDFAKGNTVSQTAERTRCRGVRRLIERHTLRRERINRVLRTIGFLPLHYANELNRYGQLNVTSNATIAWTMDDAGKKHFLFENSYNEMLNDFRNHQPELVSNDRKVPYDWTIYYLRKKALTDRITKEELAWVLLNFNQKRGYYQLRGEDDNQDKSKLEEFYSLRVVNVVDTGEKRGKDTWYNVHLENGWIYKRTSKEPLDWVGKIKDFIVTTPLNEVGEPKCDKDGNIKRSFRSPKDDDWNLLKIKTERDINLSHKTVGAYIYDNILAKPCQKIRGKLVRVVERKYYIAELRQILNKQKEFIPELSDDTLYQQSVEQLYPSNELYRQSIAKKDFTYLFVDDIILYQRPLKSKKSFISDCPYESTHDNKGNEYPVKCIATSNPLFQEFRLWQFIDNLHIIHNELKGGVDVTRNLLDSDEKYVKLFEWLNDKKEVDQKTLLSWPPLGLKKTVKEYRWNYVEDKKYPCNETRADILKRLKTIDKSMTMSDEDIKSLWHILYSVNDRKEIHQALATFAQKHNYGDDFVSAFEKMPPYKKDYGAYSEKAIKKLLVLMRKGNYWKEESIDAKTRQRIENIINGEFDETIKNRVREKAINFTEVSHFKGLPLWLACYVVYNRHSELKSVEKWDSPKDIDRYLSSFKQHSLRNPIVEQVITETLRIVRDIWTKVGSIDEIHVEMGRYMKNSAQSRKTITQKNLNNERTNLRIKSLLVEFANPELGVEGVRPYSPSQQEILRIYEEDALNGAEDVPADIADILKKFDETDAKIRPTTSDVMKYKRWLEQQYLSPYTGSPISLSRLFTSDYEIEHIIPQSRYFDDSYSNKVVCESAVNRLKDNQLGYEFINNHHGEIVELGGGKQAKILSVEAYEKIIEKHFSSSVGKKSRLMMDDIPDGFAQRQLNDSRYISKLVKALMSNIVREKDSNGEYEQEATSKNVLTMAGAVTGQLKKDWGVNDVWNMIVLPRFKRLNEKNNTNHYTTMTDKHEIPSMPLSQQRGFNKKRIDHRHHAMDAIVIACATRNHVNLLNNESAMSENTLNRYQLSHLLRRYEKMVIDGKERNVPKEFFKPWPSFAPDVYEALNEIIVSFKQNLRVINKTQNYYQHIVNNKKVFSKQTKGDNWAIRKPLHKDTVFGKVNLRMKKIVNLSTALEHLDDIVNKDLRKKLRNMVIEGLNEKMIKKFFAENKEEWSDVNISKIEIYYFSEDSNSHYFATRKDIDNSFDKKKIESSITDSGIQKIMLAHLAAKGGNPDLAFSADGLYEMNRNIKILNDGKEHKSIYKARIYEKAEKYQVGHTGNKSQKYVESAKGTNLFFAAYKSSEINKATGEIETKMVFDSIGMNVVIKRLKNNMLPVPEMYKGYELDFYLSPGDLVYLPKDNQLNMPLTAVDIDKTRIYKMVSCSSSRCFFINSTVAKCIVDKYEYSSLNKMECAETGEMIKKICIPIKVDRLGNIISIHNSDDKKNTLF